jgi:hypothetical protein
VFWWEKEGNILRERDDTIKWDLKKYEAKAWDRLVRLRIGEHWWALVRKPIKLWVPKFRGIS